VNSTDEQVLRERLHEVIGAFEAGPLPANAVRRRGKTIRTRRRASTVSGAAALAAVVAVATWAQGPGASRRHAPPVASGHSVTLNEPDPGAPGGVFASGTADGKPWKLAVANIAGPAPWCLPAVMLNGHDGDILGAPTPSPLAIGNVAFLTEMPGRPGTGSAFVQVGTGVTRLVATLSGGLRLLVHPVTVSRCGQRFRLAGFAYLEAGATKIVAYSAGQRGITSVFSTPPGIFRLHPYQPGALASGVWDDMEIVGGSDASAVIVSGRTGGTRWHISMTLGGSGQCYAGAAERGNSSGQAQECLPIEAAPRGVALAWVPFPASVSTLTGYAGLVTPRTRYLMARLSDGTTRRLATIDVGGRKYTGLAIGRGTRLVRLTLYDAAGHAFATTTSIPPGK